MHDVRLLGAERLPPLCMCIAVHDDAHAQQVLAHQQRIDGVVHLHEGRHTPVISHRLDTTSYR